MCAEKTDPEIVNSLEANENACDKRRPTYEQLIALMDDENPHGEIDWGSPVGKEIW